MGGLLALTACTDEVPTSTNPDLIPISVETFEALLDFDEFGADVRIDGGYGSPSSLATDRIVLSEDGTFEVRSLLRFEAAPGVINVVPPGESESVQDPDPIPVGGRVSVTLDTVGLQVLEPFRLTAAATSRPWDVRTASWTHAVDTLGGARQWDVPGGDTEPIGFRDVAPSEADAVTFELDSLTADVWASGDNLARGLMLSMGTPGRQIVVETASLELDLRSSINPDTVVRVSRPLVASTMLLSDQPDDSDGQLLVGGAPAFRSTFRIELPDTVDATGSICGGSPTCRVPVTPERVIFASLGFQAVPTEPSALSPADTLLVDLRPVLAPDRLPRSPLGTPLVPQGRIVPPEFFDDEGDQLLEIPITTLVRALAASGDGEGAAPSTLTLMSRIEPSGIGVATFGRIGTANAPVLRLILTSSETVTIP